MTTLTNDFHGTTEATRLTPADLVRIRETHPSDWTDFERRAVRRLNGELCGISDCMCGGAFGERPVIAMNADTKETENE